MAETRPLTRLTMAKNLRRLMDASGLKAPVVAKRAGVDRKTITNWLNGKYQPQPDAADRVAAVFGLRNFNLIDPALDLRRTSNTQLRELVEFYERADEKGRENILRVAEMAAPYKSK